MLILDRGPGESIRINDDVVIFVRRIREGENKVEIAIDAPLHLKIRRVGPDDEKED